MFKLLHVLFVVFGIGFIIGPGFIVHRIVHSKDVRAIRTGLRIMIPIGKAGPPLMMAGAVMGLVAAYVGSYNFLAPWLIATYLIFITMVILGAAFHDPWLKRVLTAAEASPDDQMSPALQEAVNTPKGGQIVVFAAPVAIMTFVILMVLKPFN
jgi:small-conductance mechanosensitive channel